MFNNYNVKLLLLFTGGNLSFLHIGDYEICHSSSYPPIIPKINSHRWDVDKESLYMVQQFRFTIWVSVLTFTERKIYSELLMIMVSYTTPFGTTYFLLAHGTF